MIALRSQSMRRQILEVTNYSIPTWDDMVTEVAADPTPYDDWRQHYATT